MATYLNSPLPSWILLKWGWVSLPCTPFVHIKIARIYGCSSPKKGGICRYWTVLIHSQIVYQCTIFFPPYFSPPSRPSLAPSAVSPAPVAVPAVRLPRGCQHLLLWRSGRWRWRDLWPASQISQNHNVNHTELSFYIVQQLGFVWVYTYILI